MLDKQLFRLFRASADGCGEAPNSIHFMMEIPGQNGPEASHSSSTSTRELRRQMQIRRWILGILVREIVGDAMSCIF